MLFLTIALIHLLALISPGPDFLLVSQLAVSRSRKQAMLAAMGITLGVMWWAGITLLGLHLLLERMRWLHQLVVIAGGAYLCWTGWRMLRSALRRQQCTAALQQLARERAAQSFIKGLLTNLSNPKVMIFFASIFSLFVSDNISGGQRLALFIMMSAETLSWFIIVACLFSLPAIRHRYQRLANWIDGIAGILFMAFGIHLILQR